MSSRAEILRRLRQARRPFPSAERPAAYLPMVPRAARAALRERFIAEAEMAGCVVHRPVTATAALTAVVGLLAGDEAVSAWDPATIPLPGLDGALAQAGIARVGADAAVRVGITGVDAALAATGSVVVLSGTGRFRAASLLPPVHIAILTPEQIMPDLEQWWAAQKAAGLDQFRQVSNAVIITGPSRTADIAMQLVMGMHGPRVLHLILMPGG